MNGKKLLLITLDAVSSGDLNLLMKMPSFSELAARGTTVRDVESVFVSNTYPAHTTMVTGRFPCKHGIIENTLFQPQHVKPDWNWYHSAIRGPTVYDELASRGGKTCAVLWPVTAGAKNIAWNMPEIFAVRKGQNQVKMSLQNGNALFQLFSMIRFWRLFGGIEQSRIDDFAVDTACYALRAKKADLTLVHLSDADNAKHHHGPDSDEAHEALDRHNLRLAKLLDTLKKTGAIKETSIIVAGDHSQLAVSKTVDLNALITPFKGKASFHQAGGSAFLRVSDSSDRGFMTSLAAAVERIFKDPDSGVGRLLSSEEMRLSGFDRDYLLGVEAGNGFSFGVEHVGQHGYSLRQKDYTTFYMAAGGGVPGGYTMSGGSIADICPLALYFLGLKPWEMDGELRIPMSEGSIS